MVQQVCRVLINFIDPFNFFYGFLLIFLNKFDWKNGKYGQRFIKSLALFLVYVSFKGMDHLIH